MKNNFENSDKVVSFKIIAEEPPVAEPERQYFFIAKCREMI